MDMTKKTIVVRTENGLEQTFKWDDTTSVQGVDQLATNSARTAKQQASNSQIRSLMGKEGSEVTVNWKDENGAKMATSIDVTQASSKANSKTGTSKNKAKRNTY